MSDPRTSDNTAPSPQLTTLMVTTVPFWQQDTGAQQRMYSLTRFLLGRGPLAVFYLHDVPDDQRQVLAERHGFQLVSLQAASSSASGIQKTWSRIRSWLGPRDEKAAADEPPPGQVLVPDDFRWPAAKSQFLRLIDQRKPDVVVIEYIALTCYAEYARDYLVEHSAYRPAIVLDAHDVMFQRCQRFRQKGKRNWLEIDRRTEAELVGKYDAVLAIQTDEAQTFRQMAPQVEVIVAGHCPGQPLARATDREPRTDQSRPTVIGFLGSHNQPNLLGAQWFVHKVWPQVYRESPVKTQLMLAGGFTDHLDLEQANLEPASRQAIRMLPQLNDLGAFYNSADIVINPVKLGTGLKIKNVEALVCGKPLVTTSHSATGLPESLIREIQIADAAEHFASALLMMLSDPAYLHAAGERIRHAAAAEFSESAVYAEFAKWLDARQIGASL